MKTRLGLSATILTLLLCLVAAGAASAFSGEAGGGFRYEDFDLTEDRELQGVIVNSSNESRRNVRVTITAIGEESGAPLWSTDLILGNMGPGERKRVSAEYGRFTADPGSFTFAFTHEGEIEPQPEEIPEEAPRDEPEDATGDDPDAPVTLAERNACSSIEDSLRGREITGTGECTSVPFRLGEGTARFSLLYSPNDPITVQLLNKEGQPLEFLFEQLTYTTGSKRISVTEEGVYSLQVLAEGEWSMRIQQAGAQAPGDDGDEAPVRRFNLDSGDDGSLSITNY
jgi:hypothetical protein